MGACLGMERLRTMQPPSFQPLEPGLAYEAVLLPGRSPESFLIFVAAMVGGAVYYGLNELITSAFVAVRPGGPSWSW